MPTSKHVEVGTTPTLLYTGDDWDPTVVRFAVRTFPGFYLGGADVATSGATGGERVDGTPVTVVCAPREKWYGIREAGDTNNTVHLVSVLASPAVG